MASGGIPGARFRREGFLALGACRAENAVMQLGQRVRWLGGLGLGLGMFLGWGCGSNTKTYDVSGIVREVRENEGEVVIRHDEIPGYMMAMTMPFDVKDRTLLKGLKVGDVVRFKLLVEPKDSWAEGFQVLSNVPPTDVVANPGAATTVPEAGEPGESTELNDPNGVSFYKDVPELNVGDLLPDYALTNQFGKRIRIADYRGGVLVLNFIFTRCPIPDFCPRASDNMGATMRLLKSRAAVPGNWKFLSVSFDPTYDTPKVLESYGKRFQYDPEKWSFAIGAFDQVQPLGSHFGLYFSRNVTPDNMNHNLRTVVIDPQGKVSEILVGKDWTPVQLADAVGKALGSN